MKIQPGKRGHATAFFALLTLSIIMAAIPAQADENATRVHVEFGPAFTAFIGGGAEETGAGFAGSLSLLQEADEFASIGLRVNYSQSYYTEILNVPGQELRTRMISGGVEVEFSEPEQPLALFVYATWGAVSIKADTFDPLSNPIRHNQNDFMADLGGGLRFFPEEHVSLGLEGNIATAWGTTADLAEWHFRLAGMIGMRY